VPLAADPRVVSGDPVCQDRLVLPFPVSQKRSKLRASDAERHETMEWLRHHAGEGRIDLDELDDRLERAASAKTVGELAALTADLPVEANLLDAVRKPSPEKARRRLLRRTQRLATIDLAAVLVWLLTGHGPFWPVYVIAFSLVMMLFSVSRYVERRHVAKTLPHARPSRT
jgi:hypothetical protein